MSGLISADMPIEQRMASDEVEKRFENWFFNIDRDSNNFCFKYGLDWKHTKGKNVQNLKGIILNTPDYICYNSNHDMYYFTEVKHSGRLFNLKQDHFENYKKWSRCYDVRFWIYNSNDRIADLTISSLENIISEHNYKITTYAEKRNDPTDCKKPMWIIPFQDLLL